MIGDVPLFEGIFFYTEKNWLTNGFTTLVGFQGKDLKIAGAVLYPKKLEKLSVPSHLDRRSEGFSDEPCIWFIIRSKVRASPTSCTRASKIPHRDSYAESADHLEITLSDGLVMVDTGGSMRDASVVLTESGRALLRLKASAHELLRDPGTPDNGRPTIRRTSGLTTLMGVPAA